MIQPRTCREIAAISRETDENHLLPPVSIANNCMSACCSLETDETDGLQTSIFLLLSVKLTVEFAVVGAMNLLHLLVELGHLITLQARVDVTGQIALAYLHAG